MLNYFVETEAGDAFRRSAAIHINAGNRHEAATQYIDASNCFKKTDVNGGS
jgi:alpha-soluble NSF attachment protein